MKPIHATLIAMAGLLALMNSPLRAQGSAAPPSSEISPDPAVKPPMPLPPKPPEPPQRPTPPEGERPSRSQRQGDEKMTPFIGVLTGPVPRELRAHFRLPEGHGLLVQEVMPDTPAKAAGLKVDDVLLRFEDQKLVNMDQLQTLVRGKSKGDVVALTVISGGAETQVSVTIAERMMPVQSEASGRGDRRFMPFGGGSSFFDADRSGPEMREMRESLERYQEKMREYQERMRDWHREGSRGSLPPAPSWKGPGTKDGGPDHDRARERDRKDGPDNRELDKEHRSSGPREGESRSERREHHETASVTRSDDSGIYSLQHKDNHTVFTARPKDGAEQSWTVNNEEERRAVPEAMQEKLRLLEEIRGNEKLTEAPGERGPKPAKDGL